MAAPPFCAQPCSKSSGPGCNGGNGGGSRSGGDSGGGAGIATGGNGNSGEGGGGSSDSNHASAPQNSDGSDCGSGGGSNSECNTANGNGLQGRGATGNTCSTATGAWCQSVPLDKQRRIDGVRQALRCMHKSTAFAGFDSTTSHWATVQDVVRTAATLGVAVYVIDDHPGHAHPVVYAGDAELQGNGWAPSEIATDIRAARLDAVCSSLQPAKGNVIVAFNGTNHYNGVCPIGHSKPASEGGAPLHSNEPPSKPLADFLHRHSLQLWHCSGRGFCGYEALHTSAGGCWHVRLNCAN